MNDPNSTPAVVKTFVEKLSESIGVDCRRPPGSTAIQRKQVSTAVVATLVVLAVLGGCVTPLTSAQLHLQLSKGPGLSPILQISFPTSAQCAQARDVMQASVNGASTPSPVVRCSDISLNELLTVRTTVRFTDGRVSVLDLESVDLATCEAMFSKPTPGYEIVSPCRKK